MALLPKVFISHSSKDHSFIDWLCKNLSADSIDYFRDDRDILAGDSLTQKIEAGLESSNFFLVVLSPFSLTSPWVQRELSAALMRQVSHGKIVIIPVLLGLDTGDIPILLQDIKAVQFDSTNYDVQVYGKIKESILDKTKTAILQRYQDSLLDNFALIDGVVSKGKPTKLEVQNILQLLQKDNAYQNYFFSKADALHWLELLKSERILSLENAPSPQPADKEGYYSIPQWNALIYLEKIAHKLKDLPETDKFKYTDDLLGIIRSVTKKRQEILKNNRGSIELDNYRTWFSFAKIIACLPKESITEEIIKLFEVWIDSTFDSALAATEILKHILPQFLSDTATPADITKAESITESMLAFKDLPREKSPLDERKRVRLLVNDHWLADAYIKRGIANKLGQKCSTEFIYKFANRLKRIIGYKNPRFIVEHGNQQYLLVVSRAEGETFTCELKKRSKPEQEDFILLVDSFTPLIKSDPFNCQTNLEFKERVLAAIAGPTMPSQAFSDMAAQLSQFYERLWDDFTYIHYKSLGDMHAHCEEAEGVYIAVLKEIINAKAKTNPDEAREIFKKFLGAEYRFPIFTRLTIYCYGRNYETYHADIWEELKRNKELLFNRPDFESEVYHLLSANIDKFTSDERIDTIAIIEAGPFGPDYTEIQKHYWRQKWYSAMATDPEFQKRYDECRKKTKTQEFINFRDSHVRSGWGKSPLSKDDILRMSNTELARFIPEFETKPKDFIDGPFPEALANILQQVASETPEKFTADFMPLLNTGYHYIYSILLGFWEHLNQNKGNLDWKNTLEFIEAYINREDFWADKFLAKDGRENREATHSWIISAVAELIQIGTQSDEIKSAPQELNDKIRIITRLCLAKALGAITTPGEETDPVSKSLNTAEGKWIKALLNLSLRLARLQGKESSQPRWEPEFKAAYEDALMRKVRDAYTIFGMYIANFNYLDKEWTLKNIGEFIKLPSLYWEAFMTGYLHSAHVYDDFYRVMFSHYKKAIAHKFPDTHAGESLAQHLAIYYLRGLDGLKESELLYDFIRNSDKIRIERLIGYLWMQRLDSPTAASNAVVLSYENNELKPKAIDIGSEDGRKVFDASINKKIIELWKYLIDFYRIAGIKTDTEKEIVSSLAKFTVFLPQLNAENIAWLKVSAPYLDLGWNTSFVLEYLTRLKDIGNKTDNASFIADIYLKIVETSLPDYKQEDIEELLEFVCINGGEEEKNKTKKICNEYASKGREDIVRKIYDKYFTT